jgi:hypothetical protein
VRPANKRKPALTTPARNETPDAGKSTACHAPPPAAPVTLFEAPRQGGTALRITRETVAGRHIVKLAHLTAAGIAVHGFVIEMSEVAAVADALRRAT